MDAVSQSSITLSEHGRSWSYSKVRPRYSRNLVVPGYLSYGRISYVLSAMPLPGPASNWWGVDPFPTLFQRKYLYQVLSISVPGQ